MAKVVVLEEQTLFDIAVQECGSIEAAFELAVNNGLFVTDTVNAGGEITGAAKVKDAVADYFAVNRLRPATRINDFELDRVFGNEFSFEFS
jgi:hypothetical protein